MDLSQNTTGNNHYAKSYTTEAKTAELHMFPFNEVKQNSRVVLWGAGKIGREYLQQIKSLNYCEVLFVVDRANECAKQIEGVDVLAPSALEGAQYDFIVVATIHEKYENEIIESLHKMHVPEEKVIAKNKYRIYRDDLFNNCDNLFYSQYGEDIIVYNLFRVLGIEKPSYIDVGAHHPHNCSNTSLLHQKGSRGINIEANPSLIGTFCDERPDDKNLNIGIDTTERILPFYILDNALAISSFSLDWVNDFISRNKECSVTKTVNIQTMPLSAVIEKYANGIWPNYMSIDIEGLDYDVLKGTDLTNGPIAVTVEIDKGAPITQLMIDKGYLPYCRTVGNITYIKKEYYECLFLIATDSDETKREIEV